MNLLLMLLGVLVVGGLLGLAGAVTLGLVLARELRLFLRAPGYYMQKALSGPGYEARARKLASRVRRLLPQAGREGPFRELMERVDRAVSAIRELERRREAIVLYLDHDLASDQLALPPGQEASNALRTLGARRGEIDQQLAASLTNLAEIERCVAAKVLGGRDPERERETQAELDETMAELEDLLKADQEAGLLPGR